MALDRVRVMRPRQFCRLAVFQATFAFVAGSFADQPDTVRVAGIVLKWLRTDKAANFQRAEKMIREAATNRAQIICTTECFLDGYAIADKGIPLVDYLALGERIPEGKYFRKLSVLAKELKVPVIVLSQLSRAPDQRDKLGKPKLSDLRDSGAIEQDADVVCMLRRPCKYDDDPEREDETLTMLDIAKHRNGPTGTLRLNFEEEFTRFTDRTDQGVDGNEIVDQFVGEMRGVPE